MSTLPAPLSGVEKRRSLSSLLLSALIVCLIVLPLTISAAEALTGNVLPSSDDTYDLGSTSLRWRDLYLGPTTLHLYCTAAECTTARDWKFAIQEGATGEGNLRIMLGASDFVNIDTSGNVGIGTAVPGVNLHIDGGAADVKLRLETDDTFDSLIQFRQGASIKGTVGYDDGNDIVSLSYGNFANSHLNIDSSGEVGIGTTVPGKHLHVFTSSGSAELKVETNSAGSATLLLDGYRSSDNPVARVRMFNIGDDVAEISAYRDGANDAANLRFYTQAASGSLIEQMRIDPSGNVGIGTTGPYGILDLAQANDGGDTILRIYNTAAAGSSDEKVSINFGQTISANAGGRIETGREDTYSLAANRDSYMAFLTALDGTNTEYMRITSAGDVGIGTTNPGDILEVAGSGHNIRFTDSGDSYNLRAQITHSDGNGGAFDLWNDSEVNTVKIRSYAISGVQAFFTAGNVGIGTASPGQKLQVSGRIRFTTSQAELYQSGTRLHVRSEDAEGVAQFASYGLYLPTYTTYSLYVSGGISVGYGGTAYPSHFNCDVGIGTAAPGRELEVVGGILYSGLLSTGVSNPNPAIRVRHLDGKASTTDTGDTLYINYSNAGKGVVIGDSGTDHPLTVYGTGTFGAILGTTLNTGQGANELYDMNQNVMTNSTVTFERIYMNSSTGRPEIYYNTSGLLLDALNDGDWEMLLYEELVYIPAIRLGYSGTAKIDTQDTNENLTIDPNGAGLTDIVGTLRADAIDMDGNIDMDGFEIYDVNDIKFQAESQYIIRVENDTDTGIYYNATNNTWDWRLNGVQKGYFDLDTGYMQMDGGLNVDGSADVAVNTNIHGTLYVGYIEANGDIDMNDNDVILKNGDVNVHVKYLSGSNTAELTNYNANGRIALGVKPTLTSSQAWYVWNSQASTTILTQKGNGDLDITGNYSDYAETIKITGKGVNEGDLVVTSSTEEVAGEISSKPYSQNLLGVISTNPGMLLSNTKNGISYTSVGTSGTTFDFKNYAPLSLAGRIPVKVTSLNGLIDLGDPITSSYLPGVGMKTTKAGPTVGKAMESTEHWNKQNCPAVSSLDAIQWPKDDGTNSAKPCFKLPDGTYVGKVMVFVNVSWHDPDVYLADSGELNIVSSQEPVDSSKDPPSHETSEGQANYELRRGSGELITRIGAFAEAVIAKIKVGLIEATQITADSIQAIWIYVDEEIISPVVRTDYLVAEKAEIGTLTVDTIKANKIKGVKFTYVTNVAVTQTITDPSTGSGQVDEETGLLNHEGHGLAFEMVSAIQEQQEQIEGLQLEIAGLPAIADESATSEVMADFSLRLEALEGELESWVVGHESGDGDGDGEISVDGDGDLADEEGKIAADTVEAREGIFEKLTVLVEAVFGKLKAEVAEIGELTARVANLVSATVERLTVRGLEVEEEGETIGSGVIEKGESEVKVETSAVTEQSKIFVTLTGDYAPATRFWVAKQKPSTPNQTGCFILQFDAPVAAAAEFNWWVIEAVLTSDKDQGMQSSGKPSVVVSSTTDDSSTGETPGGSLPAALSSTDDFTESTPGVDPDDSGSEAEYSPAVDQTDQTAVSRGLEEGSGSIGDAAEAEPSFAAALSDATSGLPGVEPTLVAGDTADQALSSSASDLPAQAGKRRFLSLPETDEEFLKYFLIPLAFLVLVPSFLATRQEAFQY